MLGNLFKQNKQVIYFLAFVVLLFITGWSQLINIPVFINDVSTKARFGQTIGSLLKENGFKNANGKLYSVTGALISGKTGEPQYIYMNNHLVKTSDIIKAPSKICIFSGRDLKEPSVSFLKIYEEEPIVTGTGPFLKLVSSNSPGLKEIIVGSISGKRVERVLKHASPAIYKKTNGHGEMLCALTFDDGPSIYTPEILKILDRYGIKATFFMIGKHVQKYPEIARLVAEKGHTIGNHSYSHPALGKLPWDSIKREVRLASEIITAFTGIRPHWFRPPMRSLSYTLFQAISDEGMTLILWDVDPFDWKNPSSSVIYERVVNSVSPGAVILLHDGGGNRSQTVDALPQIIETLHQKGYVFVPLDFFAQKEPVIEIQ